MHILITGGSSGIGRALAKEYAKKGARLSLIARRLDPLKQVERALFCQTACADITDETALIQAVGILEAANGPVDLLIACAGMVEPGAFGDQEAQTFNQQITVNLIGTANTIRSVFAQMIDRKRGRILIISSGAGLVGCPGYAAYCASKAALGGLAEVLDLEGAPFGVRTSICFPPDTLTPQFAQEIQKRSSQAQRFMGRIKPKSADDVARKIVHAMDRGKQRIDFGFSLKALRLFGSQIKPVLFGLYRRNL